MWGKFQVVNRDKLPTQSNFIFKMKEVSIFPGTKVEINDVDFPTLPDENYLIIKVAVAGSNPKDWAIAERGQPTTALVTTKTNFKLKSLESTKAMTSQA